MKASAYPRLFTSYHGGWDELSHQHPNAVSAFFSSVLPGSLLTVAMILFAATRHGDYYAPGVPLDRWYQVAGIFLLAQWFSVFLMAGIIYAIAHNRHLAARFDDCFFLSAGSAISMWLSSLTLLVPSLPFNIVCALVGLLAAFSLLIHGLPAMVGEKEGIEAMDLAYTVIAAGGILWAILCGMLILPLL